MRKKAAIELSVSFIIVLIISIVIFSMGIYLANKFFSHGQGMIFTFDERTMQEIENLLDDGSRVVIPFNNKVIHNGESDTFGIGVLNIGNSDKPYFKIRIKWTKAVLDDDTICTPGPDYTTTMKGDCSSVNPGYWLQTTEGFTYEDFPNQGVDINRKIEVNEKAKFLAGFNVKGAKPGTYIFDVKVTNGEVPEESLYHNYDSIHKIYVNVP